MTVGRRKPRTMPFSPPTFRNLAKEQEESTSEKEKQKGTLSRKSKLENVSGGAGKMAE